MQATPDVLTVAVDVAAAAAPGSRDLFVAGASRQKALAVYDKIDAIKVKPDWAMARVGGDTFPKMLAQFEAWGYSNGADGKPDSPDDIDLGMVDASWSMEEYAATYNDDDIKFVGTLNEATGRFTPNIDGPNPAARRIAQQHRRCLGGREVSRRCGGRASPRRRCGRARICWSRCRSTWSSIHREPNEQSRTA